MPLLWYCVHSASEANRRGEMNWNIFVGRKKKRRISSAESAGVCKQTHKELFPLDLILLTAAGFVFCSSLMNAY